MARKLESRKRAKAKKTRRKPRNKASHPSSGSVEAHENAPWLVMVYLAGDNTLADEMVLAMQDLMAEGPPKDDKIVAQFDPSGVGLSTQRFDFSEKKSGGLENYRVSNVSAETNTGSAANLVDFIKWAHHYKSYGRTRRHLLILAGHGSGATENFLLSDESAMDSLTIDELKDALSAATFGECPNEPPPIRRRIDILGLDACYMNMGEIAYQVRPSVDVMIGAEGPEPSFGWPYRRILANARTHRASHPPMSPVTLAKTIVTEYVEHYADYDRTAARSVDLGAILLRKKGSAAPIEKVASEFTKLVAALDAMPEGDHDKLVLAHWYAQTYKAEQFVDLRDLCIQIETRFRGRIKARSAAVVTAIEECVIKSGCSGFGYQHSYGLSIYFPWAYLSPDYGNLDFARETGWLGFLKKHLKQTRRELRRGYTLEAVILPRLLEIAKGEPSSPDLTPLERSIVHRMRKLARLPHGVGPGWWRLERAVARLKEADMPGEDLAEALNGRVVRAGALRDADHRYTGEGSRYTGEGSRYTGEGSRSPSDREKAVKNLAPAIGRDYWP